MSDNKEMPGPSNKPSSSFQLEVSDLNPEAYLAMQQASSSHQSVTLSHSPAVSYIKVPAISVSYQGSSSSIPSHKVDRILPYPLSYSIPSTMRGSRWCIRRTRRAGRPRGSRAMRPRVGSYTSQFATVAKNLSYRGCLSDLLSHQGRLSRLQILGTDFASSFQRFVQGQIETQEAGERASSSVQTYEPISPPSSDVLSSDIVRRPRILLPATPTNLFSENRSYIPICEPISSPEAGPSGLQSSTHFGSSSYVSEEDSFQEADYGPLLHQEGGSDIQKNENDTLEISPYVEDEKKEVFLTTVKQETHLYEKDLLETVPFNEITQEMKNIEASPEEVELYKNPSPEIIEIHSSDSNDESLPKLERREGETYMSDLDTTSKYYAPPTVAINPSTVTAIPTKVLINPPTLSVQKTNLEGNPLTVVENPLKRAVYPPSLAVNSSTTAMNPQLKALHAPTVIVYSNDEPTPLYNRPNRFKRRMQPYGTQFTVPGTYIKLYGSHFYGARNLELNAPPPVSSVSQSPQLGLDITHNTKKSTASPETVVTKDDDVGEQLLASPSYDVPELDVFNQDGLTEALSYINPDFSKSKPMPAKNDSPHDMPGPSGVVPPNKRGQKSSKRKSTVRLATPRPARPSRARTAKSVSGIRATRSDLAEICGKVRTTTEKAILPCGRKALVGGGLPPLIIPPTKEVQQIAIEAAALGHSIRTSKPSQEEEVLEDIITWLMDNPEEEKYQRSHPQD